MKAVFVGLADLERFPDETESEQAENLAELAALIGIEAETLYQKIKADAARELRYSDLAVTRVAADLLEIYQRNPRNAVIILDAIAHPMDSYQAISERHGISKQAVHGTLDRLGNRYPWVVGLASIKARINQRGIPKRQRAEYIDPAGRNCRESTEKHGKARRN